MAVKAEDMRSLQDTASKNRYRLASDERANYTVRSQTHPMCQGSMACFDG